MIVRSFLDSNIFVYADDHRYPAKQRIAADLFERARVTGLGVVSTQVVQEYFSVATGKVSVPSDLARRRVELMASMNVVQVDPPLILHAIDLHRLHQLSIWDALIVQAAAAAGCRQLLTEDMVTGSRLAGVEIVNPFA
jgi:predicted nucleic acid-binding protein